MFVVATNFEIRLEQESYIVSEVNGTIDVCAVIVGDDAFSGSFKALLYTEDNSAVSGGKIKSL